MSRNRGKKAKDRAQQKASDHHPLTEEEIDLALQAFLEHTAAPTTVAILGTGQVENRLSILLRKKIARSDDETWTMVNQEQGFLDTFARQILFGYAMKIYDDDVRINLGIVREIRNRFAHARKIKSFDEADIINHLKRIRVPAGMFKKRLQEARDQTLPPRVAFMWLCTFLMNRLYSIEKKGQKISAKHKARAAERAKKASYFRLLTSDLSWLGSTAPQDSLLSQAASHSAEQAEESPISIFPRQGKKTDSGGK